MPRKKTYQWHADAETEASDAPSRSAKKRQSTALQKLGEQLTQLDANARAALEKLEEEARANPVQEMPYRGAREGGERPHRREREQGAEERKQKKGKEETPAESVWEKLKHAPLLPSKTVGGSDMYKSESGYTVEL